MVHREPYQALLEAGASEESATAAAAMPDPHERVTKRDLAELEARLAWKLGAIVIGAMVATTGIFATIVGWMTR